MLKGNIEHFKFLTISQHLEHIELTNIIVANEFFLTLFCDDIIVITYHVLQGCDL